MILYSLAAFGAFCAAYVVVATVKNVVCQFRRKSPVQVYREIRDEHLHAAENVPDDAHHAFAADETTRPALTIVRERS